MKTAWGDICLALAIVAGATLLFVGAAELPPPRFEPMGSAALPRILGGLLLLFALIITLTALRQILSNKPAPLDPTPANTNAPAVESPAFSRAALLLLILVLYVGSLDWLQWPFVPVTTAFVAVVGSLLSQPRPRSLLIFGLFGFFLALAVHTVFTRLLYVDLA